MRSITELQVSTTCDGCPDSCCSQPYDWVYLTAEELDALSRASGLPANAFSSERVNAATAFQFKVLDLPCRFFDQSTGRCGVYASRPLVCRLFPLYVDPMTGDGMLLAAQCGDRLDVLEEPAPNISWSLEQYAQPIRDWVRTLWREAKAGVQRGDGT